MKPLIAPDTDENTARAAVERMARLHKPECSVCSKAGRCEIQDLCRKYRPAAVYEKRAVVRSSLGPFLERRPERCIECGRCSDLLAALGEPQTAMPPDRAPVSPLSGTLLDVCPSGAIADASARKLFRVWEKRSGAGLDLSDAAETPVVLETARGEIAAVSPADEKKPISDKGRFYADGFSVGRLDRPYIRTGGTLKAVSWDEALDAVAVRAETAHHPAGLIGRYADCESIAALKDFMASLGDGETDVRTDTEYFDVRSRQSKLVNLKPDDFAKADVFIKIGVDLRRSAPFLEWKADENPAPKKNVSDIKTLADVLDGYAFPVVFVGEGITRRADAEFAMGLIYKTCREKGVIRQDWNGYCFITDNIAVLGASELGAVSETPLRPQISVGVCDFVYLLHDDFTLPEQLGGAFTVYQGAYASEAALRADVVLPGLAPNEKKATYVNCFGQARETSPVLPPFGEAREDWKILRALSERVGSTLLPYDDLEKIRERLASVSPVFFERGKIFPAEDVPFGRDGEVSSVHVDGPEEIRDVVAEHSARWRLSGKEKR